MKAVPPPRPGSLDFSGSRLLAVDPSLKASGWALFDVASARLLTSGVISPPGPSILLSARLEALQEDVEALLHRLALGKRDVLVCEGPAPLVHNPLSALKVEGVRGIFETIARSRKVVVPGRLNPRTVQTELLGMKGRQLGRHAVKAWAKETAERLFGDDLARSYVSNAIQASSETNQRLKKKVETRQGERTKGAKPLSQDIIDASLIGVVALSRLQTAERCGIELHVAFSTEFRRRCRPRHSVRGEGFAGWDEQAIRNLTNEKVRKS